jgi:hypothetical protein
MMDLEEYEIDRNTVAIVCFGPATPATGLKAADYYQVTIDPNMCSPSGKYIYFGWYEGDQITGWQRVTGMTIVEVLSDASGLKNLIAQNPGYQVVPGATVKMMKVT